MMGINFAECKPVNSHFLSSCTSIQGLECLVLFASTLVKQTGFILSLSFLPPFIKWPPLWLTVVAGWLTTNILCSDIHSTILCPPPDPPEKKRADFHIGHVDFSKSFSLVHGSVSKTSWMLQVSPEHIVNLSPTMVVTSEFSLKSFLVAKQGVERWCVALCVDVVF